MPKINYTVTKGTEESIKLESLQIEVSDGVKDYLDIDAEKRYHWKDICEKINFIAFYADRKGRGLVVEKSNSLYCRDSFSDKDVERNILSNPYKRYEEMNMLHHTKTLGIIELDKSIFKKLCQEEIDNIRLTCDEKLDEYYKRLDK